MYYKTIQSKEENIRRFTKRYFTKRKTFLILLLMTMLIFHFLREEINSVHEDLKKVEDFENFMAKKEREYSRIRERVADMCQSTERLAGLGLLKFTFQPTAFMIYIQHKNVAYCKIGKTGTSTWTRNMMLIAGEKPKVANHNIVSELFPFPLDISSVARNSNVTSLVILRHPLSRVVSAYFSKIIILGQTSWYVIRRDILHMYHPTEENKNLSFILGKEYQPYAHPKITYPTPDQFLKFIRHKEDRHWNPLHVMCPFCQFNFTIYSKLENVEEDKRYFEAKLGINLRQMLNEALLNSNYDFARYAETKNMGFDHDKQREYRFWATVKKSTIRSTLEFYDTDFKMFDYSPQQYFEDLGINI